MQRMRALIADDEPLARARLLRLLGQFPEIEVVADCGNGEDAISAMHAQQPDVVFLDIQMPDMDGFDVLDSLPRARQPHVVFVTAYSEHAVRAFEARAVDYLLKPVSAERLRQAVERLRFSPVARDTPAYPERLAVPIGARIHLVPTADIDHVGAHANYVELHMGVRSLVLRETLSHLESRLDPKRFLRVHRSRIVRLDGVVEAQAQDSGRYLLRLQCGARLVTGRSYSSRIRSALGVE
jgi:two-component system LytT family response regulator